MKKPTPNPRLLEFMASAGLGYVKRYDVVLATAGGPIEMKHMRAFARALVDECERVANDSEAEAHICGLIDTLGLE
jgi:hypothetical protein